MSTYSPIHPVAVDYQPTVFTESHAAPPDEAYRWQSTLLHQRVYVYLASMGLSKQRSVHEGNRIVWLVSETGNTDFTDQLRRSLSLAMDSSIGESGRPQQPCIPEESYAAMVPATAFRRVGMLRWGWWKESAIELASRFAAIDGSLRLAWFRR